MDNNLVIPDYIGDVLYETGGIKGAGLHKMVEEAIRKDGKVPPEDVWRFAVDSTSDECCPVDFQQDYPNVANVLMDFFIP